MCCYRDMRNFEKFNNIVQVMLNKAISFIQTLPKDCKDQQDEEKANSKQKEEGDKAKDTEKSDSCKTSKEVAANEKGSDSVGDQAPPDVDTKPSSKDKCDDKDKSVSDTNSRENKDSKENAKPPSPSKEEDEEEDETEDPWTLDEKDRLFNFVSKVFLMNFPLYVAYKHTVQTTLDELSQQEAAALNNYCELNVSTSTSHCHGLVFVFE